MILYSYQHIWILSQLLLLILPEMEESTFQRYSIKIAYSDKATELLTNSGHFQHVQWDSEKRKYLLCSNAGDTLQVDSHIKDCFQGNDVFEKNSIKSKVCPGCTLDHI